MPSLVYFSPLDMMLDYQSCQEQTQHPPLTHQHIPLSPEYPEPNRRQTPFHPRQVKGGAAEMYGYSCPVDASYQSASSFNYGAAMTQQLWTQLSPELTSIQHPSLLGPTAANLSSCAKGSAASTQQQQQQPSSLQQHVSSSITDYPSSPATGGSDWGACQINDGFSNDPNSAAFPTFSGTSIAACAMTGSIPTFDDFTTGYPTVPTQMFPTGAGQQLETVLDTQMVYSYVEWEKTSNTYRVNPQTGKTRTKDKYRVVYTDDQRLGLERAFHDSHYITMRRKSELSLSLGLSERQIKIWFQNRRAKERKQNKKCQAEQVSYLQVDFDQDKKHDKTATSPATTTAYKQQHLQQQPQQQQQQHHLQHQQNQHRYQQQHPHQQYHQQQQQQQTSDSGLILRSACAQAMKSEPVDSTLISGKDVGHLYGLRNEYTIMPSLTSVPYQVY